jgi:hypothetical protein
VSLPRGLTVFVHQYGSRTVHRTRPGRDRTFCNERIGGLSDLRTDRPKKWETWRDCEPCLVADVVG